MRLVGLLGVVYLSQQQELSRAYLENSTVQSLGTDTLNAYDGWPFHDADEKSMDDDEILAVHATLSKSQNHLAL